VVALGQVRFGNDLPISIIAGRTDFEFVSGTIDR